MTFSVVFIKVKSELTSKKKITAYVSSDSTIKCPYTLV